MTNSQPALGAHTFIWAPAWSKANAAHVACCVADAGLSIVEIPLLDPTQIDVESTVSTLRRYGLTATCSLGLPRHAHAPDDPDAAIEFLVAAIDKAAAIGSSWLTGALYGHLGSLTGSAATPSELDIVAHVIEVAADHANERGVRLGLEIINRYETYILNTAEQMLDLLHRIDRPGTVSAHLDTFHMNIEEPGIAQAIRLLGDSLGYVHLAESNRGAIGSGSFPFGELFCALHEIHFDGPAVIEAFINAPPEILVATASWRATAADPATFIEHSVAHIRSHLDHWTERGSDSTATPDTRHDDAL